MPNIIASQTTAADSADFTQASGVVSTIHLTTAGAVTKLPFGAYAEVQIKAASNAYIKVAEMDSEKPFFRLDFPGTFRVRKFVTTDAFGVDRT